MLLDDRDRAILRLLQADGRLTNSDLAQRVSLSASACLRRVRALEEAGLVDGYVALLNARAAGLAGTAFVLVTLDQQGRMALDRFEAAIGKYREIQECYLLAGAADYMVRIAYADAEDFERIHTAIITQLPGVHPSAIYTCPSNGEEVHGPPDMNHRAAYSGASTVGFLPRSPRWGDAEG